MLVPVAPGITAAMGLLGTDLRYEHTRSVITNLYTADQAAIDRVNAVVDGLRQYGRDDLDGDGIDQVIQHFEVIAEVRYHGQGFELRVPMPESGLTLDNKRAVMDAFHRAHEQDYGYRFDDKLVELYSIRVIATAAMRRLELDPLPDGTDEDVQNAFLYERQTVFDDGSRHPTPRLARDKLGAGTCVNGPAIITQHNSTTLVPPGYAPKVEKYGSLRLTKT